jgi:hypothetical protein
MGWLRSFRDWCRGFTDEDVRSLQTRLRALERQYPGEMIWLTPGETMALSRGRVVGVWTIKVQAIKWHRARVWLKPQLAVALEP